MDKNALSLPIQLGNALGTTVTDRRIDVLRAIQQSGSISEAARLSGVSYKAAWQAVETLNNLSGVELVSKLVGGSGGGGARLTVHGLQLLAAADALRDARQQALERIERGHHLQGFRHAAIASLGFVTSMRNQLPCQVAQVDRSGSNARVQLSLGDDQALVSQITHESVELLGLRPGDQVMAMFKATAVVIAPEIVVPGGSQSRVNLLRGTIARREPASDSTEVSVQVTTNQALVGFSRSRVSFKLRQPVMAAIDESAVVIGRWT